MPPQIDLQPKDWRPSQCAVFFRSREQHGDLSNMTFGFPLNINGLKFQGPEGLYQALKFPEHPKIQRQIASRKSGMEAKQTAYQHHNRTTSNWDNIKLDAMTLTLAVKLAQHPGKFGAALKNTAQRPIVEKSSRDTWWGAKPLQNGNLKGANALGQLLTILRDLHQADPETAAQKMMEQAALEKLTLNGQPITTIPTPTATVNRTAHSPI